MLVFSVISLEEDEGSAHILYGFWLDLPLSLLRRHKKSFPQESDIFPIYSFFLSGTPTYFFEDFSRPTPSRFHHRYTIAIHSIATPQPFSNFALPSSIHASNTNSPASSNLTGTLLTPPRSFPIVSLSPFSPVCKLGSLGIQGWG